MFLHSQRHLLLFYHGSELHFLPSNLHSHGISFLKSFDSFFCVIILKTCIFKSSALFGTDTLLDKSLRVFQLPNIYLIQPQMDSSKILLTVFIRM